MKYIDWYSLSVYLGLYIGILLGYNSDEIVGFAKRVIRKIKMYFHNKNKVKQTYKTKNHEQQNK